MIGLEIVKEALPEHLEEIKKIGFDYACDDIDPKKFKYQTQEEKDAFVKGYEEGLATMSSMNFGEERTEAARFNR